MFVRVVTFVVLAAAALPGYADTTAYRSTGAHGEVLFTDIPSDSADVVLLPSSDETAPTSQQQITLMLEVAAQLAEARERREALRQNRRAQQLEYQRQQAQARETPRPDHSTRYGYPLYVPHPPRHGHYGHRPPRPEPEPARETQHIRLRLPD